MAGCADSNIFGVRADIPDDLAAKLESLVATEQPFMHPATPKHLERYLALLDGDGPDAHKFGLIYELPHSHPHLSDDARLISSDSEEGQDLKLSWATDGLPGSLVELGSGSFGSRPSDGVDGGLPVLGKVLEAFDGFEATATNDRQCGVAKVRRDIRLKTAARLSRWTANLPEAAARPYRWVRPTACPGSDLATSGKPPEPGQPTP